MSRVFARTERVVDARPDAVYAILTDYKNKRPLMLTSNFLDYRVEQGGKGTGTVVSYRLQAANRERPYQMRSEETMKGRVLTERDNNSSLVTTWNLYPVDEGLRTKVRVTTQWEGSSGIGGFFERTFAPLGLRRIYNRMLDLLFFVVPPSERTTEAFGEQPETSSLTRVAVAAVVAVVVAAVVVGLKYWQQNRQA